MVTVVVCPAIHVVGEMEEMDAPAAQGSCAWQKAEESRNKNVAARRSGPGIAPPHLTQELAHGFDPFDGLAANWAGKTVRSNCTRLAPNVLRKKVSLW